MNGNKEKIYIVVIESNAHDNSLLVNQLYFSLYLYSWLCNTLSVFSSPLSENLILFILFEFLFLTDFKNI